jgi:phage repressor protein C with HTH and peptisase S24 domain
MDGLTPAERLAHCRKVKDFTLRDMAEPLGLSNQSIHRWEKGQANLPELGAIAIEAVFGISAKWLMRGEGSMMTGKRPAIFDQSTETKARFSSFTKEAQTPLTLLPLYPSLPATGSETGIESVFVPVSHMPFDTEWLRKRIELPPEHLFLTEIDGNSMVPTLNPNDLIMVDTSADSLNFKEGIWVFRLDNTIQIKRVQRLGQEKYQAISDNSNYPPFMLEKPFDFIGRMVWSAKRW